jgi:hypothetical protein
VREDAAYSLLATADGVVHGLWFADAARGAEVAGQPDLVDALLVKDDLLRLIGQTYRSYPRTGADGGGYVIEFDVSGT